MYVKRQNCLKKICAFVGIFGAAAFGRSCKSLGFQEEIPLLFADRHSKFFHHLQKIFPHLALLAHRLVAQQIRRMICRHERRAAIRLPVAAQFRDANGLAEQAVHRRCAERNQNFWPDQINLLVQIRNAGCHFVGCGLAVAGGLAGRVGPAFQNVRDVDVRARKSGGLDDFREQLSGATDERLALFVFVRARRFTDEHQLRVNAPDTEYDIFAR